jgi:ligand-binding sensor protein
MDGVGLAEILDSKVVRDFRRLFYEITGMVTSLSFPHWRGGTVDCLPRNAKCQFCRIVQASPRGMELCCLSDERNSAPIRETGKPYICSCYLGLSGIAAPVFLHAQYVGAVLAGDVLTQPPSPARFARIRKALAGSGVDLAALEEAYQSVPVVPRRTVHLGSPRQ